MFRQKERIIFFPNASKASADDNEDWEVAEMTDESNVGGFYYVCVFVTLFLFNFFGFDLGCLFSDFTLNLYFRFPKKVGMRGMTTYHLKQRVHEWC